MFEYKYFRIHTHEKAYITQQPRGLFTAIGKLVDSETLDQSEVEEYWKNRRYFEAQLPVPPFYEDGNSIKAITWFKNTPEGTLMFQKMDFYFAMARKYGLELSLTQTNETPGCIVYEDEFQIAVVHSKHEGVGYNRREYR